ncbi:MULTISPECIES: hypothetical protein [unclassified Paenibacillus]|jgi:hypothetical protein|uniref:capping complex subunit for YIEGIA n=1 Tax=unclassified Paenibacillus TaxID=185978 RepID=UPI00277F7EAF|nr:MULTISPECIES: hypothetical protein [unclassified Paenibacillus]MDF2649978.1 hypothetical protein [Paenibacillus sp.]MDQ0898306.1 hypothetical protein [Paenibacillus sp. V4I7]MDQ0915682.1 hypothetical protein [Paenibacillus sp. V4I5]
MSKILAIVTLTKERIGGGAPIFVVDKEDELQKVSFSLEKILDANAHDLKNGTMILVKHT